MSGQNWFDDLAKTLSREHSRRDLLRGIGAAFAGAALAFTPTPYGPILTASSSAKDGD